MSMSGVLLPLVVYFVVVYVFFFLCFDCGPWCFAAAADDEDDDDDDNASQNT